MEFFDDIGEYRGITADFLVLIQERLKIRFDIVRLGNWDEVIRQTREGKVDVWGAAAKTAEREEYMGFTRPYIDLPAVIIVRQEETRNLTMSQLDEMRVVLIKNYASKEFIEQNYPELNTIAVPDIETGLRMVSFGIADAIVATNAAAVYYIEKNGLTNLRVAGESGFEWHLHFASRKDWPMLNEILQKGLDSISEEEKLSILRRWIHLEYTPRKLDKEDIMLISVTLAGLIFLFVVLWVVTLRRQVGRQTETLKKELQERKILEDELRRLATTDELTGILNRRRLLEVAKDELDRARRYHSTFAMALFDVDHFKVINDTYGHEAGDTALRELAKACQETLRGQDRLGRLGGEEFLILLVETDEETAMQVAERLRYRVEHMPLHTKDGEQFHMTISIGVAGLGENIQRVEELMSCCDKAMYNAKHQGRNRVVLYSDELFE